MNRRADRNVRTQRTNRGRRKKKQSRAKWIAIGFAILIVILAGAGLGYIMIFQPGKEKPEDLLAEYMNHIEKQEYEEMYSMIEADSLGNLDKDGYIERNSNIYEGIEATNLKIDNVEAGKKENQKITVTYDMSLDTMAGEVSFQNQATFQDTKEGYKLLWDDSLIFPNLEASDKVSVTTSQAERGNILDRNGTVLAGKGVASSVGIVPGKLENKEEAIQKLSELLGIDTETIDSKLNAGWVKDDSFVPIATIAKVSELDSMTVELDEKTLQERERQEQLLAIGGVMISDTEVRSYSLGEAGAHLIGYVQGVTAEDIEEHPDEGYTANSVIGRSGMEGLFETELKGQDGCEISIISEEGKKKDIVASIQKQDGEDIQLTIDANLQKALYEQFQEDPGCSVAVNPYTGEVLALVSTPSYDNNEFITGMSDERWNALNEDENQPLYNRFRQTWCPGSTFKPVIAAIGLKTGAIDPNEDYGNEGLSWQKDASWGSYFVTTLHAYEPVVLKSALIYSDNIYFAKAALKIGTDALEKALDDLGFNQELPFEITMAQSQYSNTETIESEIQLADSGYGQGQVLINPLHLASIYTAFLNEGNIIKPYLRYQEDAAPEVWISQAFSADTVNLVMEGMDGVVNDPGGTAYSAHRDYTVLAGKTGTAELKENKEDETGTEIGWFAVFTEDKAAAKPILVVSMVENVKGIGGSTYVVNKDMAVLDAYLQ